MLWLVMTQRVLDVVVLMVSDLATLVHMVVEQYITPPPLLPR